MKKENFYWQKLLLAWEDNEHSGYGIGLSIPYLVGVKQLLDSTYKPSLTDTADLLNEIMNNGIKGRQVIIRNCGDHEATMIGLTKLNLSYTDSEIPDSKNVIAEDIIFAKYGHSRESIISGLVNEYSSQIQNQEFSVHFNQWGYYNDDEKNFIKAVLK